MVNYGGCKHEISYLQPYQPLRAGTLCLLTVLHPLAIGPGICSSFSLSCGGRATSHPWPMKKFNPGDSSQTPESPTVFLSLHRVLVFGRAYCANAALHKLLHKPALTGASNRLISKTHHPSNGRTQARVECKHIGGHPLLFYNRLRHSLLSLTFR